MTTRESKGLLLPFIALLLPGIASIRSINLPAFWMHIAQGQSGIPRGETFSYISDGSSYVNVHWLYDILLALLYNSTGSSVIILLHTSAILSGFFILMLAARKYAGPLAIAFAVLISTWLMLVKLDPRPIFLAFPFIALIIYTLEQKPSSPKHYAVIGISQWFWAAIHPSFLLGPILCAVYAYCNSQDKTDTTYSMKKGLIAAGVAAGVTLLNPYGPGLHSWAISHLPLYFQPISLTNLSTMSDAMGADWFRIVLYIALLVSGGGLLTYKERLPLSITATSVGVAVLTILNVGRISYHLYAIFGFVFIAISCQALGHFIRGHFKEESPLAGIIGMATLGVVMVGTLTSLMTGAFFQATGSSARLGLGLTEQSVTDGAIEFLSNKEFPEKLVNLPIDGGKLVAKLPQRKIFLDSRMGIYPRTLLNEVTKSVVHGDAETWELFEEQYEPDAVLVNLTARGSHNGVRMILEGPEWRLAYFDGISVVLLKNKAEWASLTSYTSSQVQGLSDLEDVKNRAIADLTRGAIPALPLQLAGAGNLFQALNRFPEANALFEVAFASAPQDIDLLNQLAISRFNVGDYELSKRSISELVNLQPENAFAHLWQARVMEVLDQNAEAATAYSRGYDLNPELADTVKKAWGLKSGL